VSDHDCVRCPQCDSCPVCAADALGDEVVVREELFAAWEAHKKAYEIVRAEMDDIHRTLTQCGAPEQIPPFKTALAPAKARVLFLSARCNQLFDEAEDLRERLDQFEAYDITVKSALDDRARAERAEALLTDDGPEGRRVTNAQHVALREDRDRAVAREAGRPTWDDLRAAQAAREKAEAERDAYRHEWNVSSRQQGAETRARKAAESRAAEAKEEKEGKRG